MARTFAATSDQLRFPIINQMTGSYSIGAWVRRNSDSTFDTIYSRCTSANQAKIALQINTGGKIALEQIGVGEVETSTLTVKAADGWCFVGVHKPGSEAARAHVWKQASGWTHQNMSGTLGNAVTAGASSTVRIGEWQGGTTDNFDGDIEVVVEYNLKLIGNNPFESLAFSREAMLSFGPTGLWELRQASVEQKVGDLSGTGMNESVRAGTSVTSRSCPFYFAGGPPLYTRQPEAGGTVVDLAGEAIGTGTLAGTLTTVANLAGSLVGLGTINGELRAIASLQGSATGLGTLNGQLVTVASLSASMAGAGTLAGELRVLASLTASLVGAGAIAGELRALAVIAGHLEGSGVLDAELTRVASLAATLAGGGSLVGLLELVLGQRLVLPTRAVVIGSRTSTAVVFDRPSRARVRLNRTTLAELVPSRPTTAAIAAAGARATVVANPRSAARVSRRASRTKLHR